MKAKFKITGPVLGEKKMTLEIFGIPSRDRGLRDVNASIPIPTLVKTKGEHIDIAQAIKDAEIVVEETD